MDLRLGPKLHDRVRTLADRYGKSMAWIVEAADRLWEKRMRGCRIELGKGDATSGRSPLTVKCDRDPAELRAIIDWYITPYENADPQVPSVPAEVLAEAKKLEAEQRKVQAMTIQAEARASLAELSLQGGIE